MHTFTSDYKRREQNGESHSNLNSVLARCTVYLQLTPDYYERQEFAIMMIRRKSEAEIPTASPRRSWPHIHTVALLQQLLPIGCHKRGSRAHTIQSPTQWHVSQDVWWWYISAKLSPHEISVRHFRLREWETSAIGYGCINDNVWRSLTQFDSGSITGLVTWSANQYKEQTIDRTLILSLLYKTQTKFRVQLAQKSVPSRFRYNMQSQWRCPV